MLSRWVAVLSALFSSALFAFPEMVRHSYVNCTSCHVSPTGSGVLTPYGRVLAGELLSTWSTEKEPAFAYGLVHPPDWLTMGGDFRAIQIRQETSQISLAQFIFMQEDLEAAAAYGKFKLVATAGYQAPTDDSSGVLHHFLSRRHYALYQASDSVSFRAGRFHQAFGLMPADHAIVTRRGLGWDESSETYNLEAAYIGSDYDAFVTVNLGNPYQEADFIERGAALRGSLALAETYKLGASYFYGTRTGQTRHVYGPYAILGFTPHSFLLLEADLQNKLPASAPTTFGFVSYARLDYEAVQGLHFYLTEEISRLSFSDEKTLTNAHGIGVQFFPRPHFEINAFYQKQRVVQMSPDYADFAAVMLHFYP